MKVRKKQAVVGLVLLLEIAVVLIFAKVMVPIRDGSSAGFWRNVCGVDLGGADKGYVRHIYMPCDGWYIYFNQGMHGRFIFRVRRSVAVADYPEVLERIEQSVNEEGTAPGVRRVYKVFEQNRSQVEQDPDKLLSLLRDEKMKQLKQMDEEVLQFFISAEQEFAKRWIRIQRFWINVILEILFFVSLSLFAFWSWLRNKGKWSASFHPGLPPLLLFLPHYLGYSGWTFTSAGPSGGATGQFTHYLPFVNIRWQASVWGQAWRQIWSREVSIPGRLFRFIMIVWNVPIMLIGLLFRSNREKEKEHFHDGTSADYPNRLLQN